MRFLRYFGLLGMLLALGGGCGKEQSRISFVEFMPNPATVVDGFCRTDAQLISQTDATVSLKAMDALFIDSNGDEARFALASDELSSSFGVLEVSGRGMLEGSLSFDLIGEGLSLPADGTVVFVSTEPTGIVHFVGSLTCEGT